MKKIFLVLAICLSFATQAMEQKPTTLKPFIKCYMHEEGSQTEEVLIKVLYFDGKAGYILDTRNADAIVYVDGDKYLEGSEGWKNLKPIVDAKLKECRSFF